MTNQPKQTELRINPKTLEEIEANVKIIMDLAIIILLNLAKAQNINFTEDDARDVLGRIY